MTDLRPGKLLVASPVLVDPNFFRSVVVLMAHGDDGAVGVILDRPLEAAVATHIPVWVDHLTPPKRVFEGGPVQRETAIGVARRPGIAPTDDWQPAFADVGFIDVARDPADVPGMADARVFSGYAGWGPGQLEMETSIGSWFVLEGSADDVFDPAPATLWRRVLRREPWYIARYANYPLDPRDN
jgi:putative transcriptional regulator